MVLDYYHTEKSIEELAELLHATPEYGCDPEDIVRVAQELGFAVEYKQNSSLDEVRRLVEKGIPVIVEWFSPEDNGHYSPVVGFEAATIVLADPLLGTLRKIDTKQFEYRWFELDNYPPQNQASFRLREIIVITPNG